MIIRVISVGNKPNQWESRGIEFYTKQLPKNLSIDFINLKSQQNPNFTLNEVLDRESSLILSKISKNDFVISWDLDGDTICLLYTSPSPRDATLSRMPSSA